MTAIHHDDISLTSAIQEFKGYRAPLFRKDMMAGLAVALLAFPQAVAYSIVAGLPPSCGLLAAICATMITAMFGSSRHLVVGPSNAIAILLQSAVAEIIFTYYRDVEKEALAAIAWQVTIQITFLVGLFQVLASLFKLGRLTQFVSHSVIVAYLIGTALAIFITQSFTFLGISQPLGVSTLYHKAKYMLTHLDLIHWPTAIVGLGSLFLYLSLKSLNVRYRRSLPAPLIMIICSSLFVAGLGLAEPVIHPGEEATLESPVATLPTEHPGVFLVGDAGDVTSIKPKVEVPFFDLTIFNKMLPVAFALALLGILETSSVGKTISASSGQRLSVNQELFGLGLGNLISSFVGAMPSSGSPSRSMLNYSCGAQTRMAAILSGVFIAAFLLISGPWIASVPLTTLAALLLVTSLKLVDRRHFLLCLKATRSDAMVLLITIISCLFFTIDIAFYIGVVLSITLYLKKASSPHLREYSLHDGSSSQRGLSEFSASKQIRVINVEGELFFGAADLFQATLKAIAEDDDSTKVIILRLKNARDIDATACMALEQLNDYLKRSGRFLLGCGIKPYAWDVLCDSGIIDAIGKDNLFIYEDRNPNQSLQRALKRAHELLGDDMADHKTRDFSSYTLDDSSLSPITLKGQQGEMVQSNTL